MGGEFRVSGLSAVLCKRESLSYLKCSSWISFAIRVLRQTTFQITVISKGGYAGSIYVSSKLCAKS